jgi:hypothetical protein
VILNAISVSLSTAGSNISQAFVIFLYFLANFQSVASNNADTHIVVIQENWFQVKYKTAPISNKLALKVTRLFGEISASLRDFQK